MYVCNIHEKDLLKSNPYIEQVREIAAIEDAKVVVVSAAVEAEVAELPKEDRAGFLQELGLKESGLQQVIREGMELLKLITFFTARSKRNSRLDNYKRFNCSASRWRNSLRF